MNDFVLYNMKGKCDTYIRGNPKIHSTVKGKGLIYIDDGTVLNEFDELYGGEIRIGKYCSFARNVTIQAVNHNIHLPSLNRSFYRKYIGEDVLDYNDKPVIIDNDVWFGTKSIVLPNVHIGSGAIIGAGAVVTKDIKPYTIVGGVPAKPLSTTRFSATKIEQLLNIKWWNWDYDKIKRNKKFFETNLNDVNNILELIVE